MRMPQLLQEWWELVIFPVLGYAAYVFFKNKKLNLEFLKYKSSEIEDAASVARKAQQAVAGLTLDLIEKDEKILELSGENAILYRAIVSIHIKCESCSQGDLDMLPEKIKGKILQSINQQL
jgi:hypothetical protein